MPIALHQAAAGIEPEARWVRPCFFHQAAPGPGTKGRKKKDADRGKDSDMQMPAGNHRPQSRNKQIEEKTAKQAGRQASSVPDRQTDKQKETRRD